MNMNEMMRNSANQKKEQEQPSSTLRDELQKINERLSLMETKEDQSELMEQLAALNVHLTALKASGQRTLRDELQALSQQLAAMETTRPDQTEQLAQNVSSVARVAEQLLKTAKQKEDRTSETLKESHDHARQTRLVLSNVEETARKIQQAAKTIEGTPKSLTATSKAARQEITKSLRFLTLKAAGVGVVIAITTFLLVTLAGVMLIRNQGLSLKLLNEQKAHQLEVGEEIYQMLPTWNEEELEQWKTLMRDEETTTNENPPNER